jgi:hypothetical protein
MTAVYIIIGINTLFALFFYLMGLANSRSEMKFIAGVMLLTPPVGVICYIGQYLIRTLSFKPKQIPLDEVGFDKSRRDRLSEPDVEAEMQAVPLEELFLISSDADKRKGILTELKKESAINYGAVAKALDIDDPESSHYAAAALANAKAEFENELRDFDNRYTREPKNEKLCREYAARVRDFLDSGILAGVELKRYHYLNINLLSSIKKNEKPLEPEDYGFIVKSAFYNKEFGMAEEWALEGHEAKQLEMSYLNLLKIYYDTGRNTDFFATLLSLKQSDVELSETGLNLVRFFAAARKTLVPMPIEPIEKESKDVTNI